MQRLERQIEKLAVRIGAVEAELAALAAGGSGDYARMAAAGEELADLRRQHDDAESQWLELAEGVG